MMHRIRTPHLVIGWAVIAAAGVAIFIAPRWQAIHSLESRAASLAQMVDESEDVNSKIESITKWVDEVEVEVRESTIPIPAESDVAGLIRSLSAKLTELDIKDREITTGTPVEDDEASMLPMSVMLTGPFPRVYDAIRWIESRPRLLRIRRVRCDRLTELSRGEAVVRAELVLDAFFAPKALNVSADDAFMLGAVGEGH